MNNKIITVAAIALSSALSATSVSAHVAGGALTDGSGNAVKSSYTKCIKVADGSFKEVCQDAKPAVKTPEVVAAPPVPKAVSKAVSISGDANFATNSDQLSDAGKAALDEFAARALELKLSGINVTGHADSRGEASYNQKLSERRANTVKTYLESKGIVGSLITASGEGETSPVASNDTKEGRAQNRRVDLIVRGYTK